MSAPLVVFADEFSVLPGASLVYDPLADNPLHDMPGVEGRWGSDGISVRDKEPDESRLWHVRV